MPAKTPIYLKPNAGKNGTSGGKGAKKLREILSAEMISPPLGDFRHMAHVGRGGKDDMFGDTTFLQQKGAASNNGSTGHSAGIPGFQSFRRKGAGKNSKKRNNSAPDDEWSGAGPENGIGEKQSPILQSAFPLPVHDRQSSSTPSTPGQCGREKVENNNTEVHITSTPDTRLVAPTKPRRLTNDDVPGSNGHVENKKSVKANGVTTVVNKNESHAHFSDTTSMDEGWSLELDLGTSLMDDVMGIMDKIEL